MKDAKRKKFYEDDEKLFEYLAIPYDYFEKNLILNYFIKEGSQLRKLYRKYLLRTYFAYGDVSPRHPPRNYYKVLLHNEID